MNFNKLIILLGCNLFLLFFTFSTSVYSVCLDVPTTTNIYSGSNNLGEFNNGESVFINPDLINKPLKLIFNFENTQDNCFSSKSNVLVKLFQSGANVEANSFQTNLVDNLTFVSQFEFIFSPNVVVSGPFISSYSILSSGNNINSGSFSFDIDSLSPEINFNIDNVKNIYNKNEIVNINYDISDLGSGLDSIIINGISSDLINFETNNRTYNGLLSLNLTSSGLIVFTAIDKLGNQISKNISFVVDSTAPVIINNLNSQNFDKVYDYVNGIKRVTFKNLKFSDDSFSSINEPRLIGNFSSINNAVTNLEATCRFLNQGNYECDFPPIEIGFSNTANVDINFKIIDSLNNYKDYSFNTEIYVDTQGPQILDFYFMNSINIINKVSIFDNNSYVYLRFSEDSINLNDQENPVIIPDFDLLSFPNNLLSNSSCNFDSTLKEGICIWEVGNKISIYTDNRRDGGLFKVQIFDKFGNVGNSSFSFVIDNIFPVIENIELIESGVQDGIVKSGESVDFRIYVRDDNLIDSNGNYLISADFTDISNIRNDIRSSFSCSQYNSTSKRCDFLGIQVRNGYRNGTILFNVSDIVGNRVYTSYNLEIFKVGNEEINAFSVIDLNKENPNNTDYLLLLNPINRNNILKNNDQIAWFEGSVNLTTLTDPFKIVNFGIKDTCDFSGDTSLLRGSEKLYPEDIIYYRENGDEKFAIKVRFSSSSSAAAVNDLNDIFMNCTLSVLKRDNTTVYNPELINFSLKIGFYDIPRGNILKAQATKVLELVNEANFLGDWFDKIYKIYNVLKGLCTVITTGSELLNTVESIMNTVQIAASTCDGIAKAASGTSCTAAAKSLIEAPKTGLMETLTISSDSFIKKACAYVSCTNGLDIFGGGGDTDLFSINEILNNFQNDIGDGLCKVNNENSAIVTPTI